MLRRLLRLAVNGFCLVSLVLCMATCALWVRGHWRLDVAVASFDDVTTAPSYFLSDPRLTVYSGRTGTSYEADSACGEFVLSRIRFHGDGRKSIVSNRAGSYPVGSADKARGLIEPDAGQGARALGWIFWRWDDPVFSVWYVVAPCWAVALATVLPPAVAAGRWVRSLRHRGPGLCHGCGYDLRATPQGGGPLLDRCPECGAAR